MDIWSTPPRQISPPIGAGWGYGNGTRKTEILLTFYQISEYKRPHGVSFMRFFHDICSIYSSFQDAIAIKIYMDLLKKLRNDMGFHLGGRSPKFQRPLAAKLCVRSPNVLEVQERARDRASPGQTRKPS